MKINRRDPRHLAVLTTSIVTACFAVMVRWLSMRSSKNTKQVVFYGHTLNGNLRAFYDYLAKHDRYDVHFLVLDKNYHHQLLKQGEPKDRLLNALSFRDMYKVGKADAIITSHGLHFFSILRRLTSIKFVDVWHGIPYKGFDEDDMRHLHAHSQTWVSSPLMKDMYINKFGFSPDKVRVTGYARVDKLIDGSLIKEGLLEKYQLKKAKKYVLIAPTWAQDEKGRSLLPFNTKEQQFFGELDKIAREHDALIIFRTHLNSSESVDVSTLTNTIFMPYAKYENAEEFLFISDILITDWSSIAFDYLPLDRPTIFLDVKAPFKKGFSLGPEYRFGELANNFDSLKDKLDLYLKTPETYMREHKAAVVKAKQAAYGPTLDGKSTLRYEKELHALLD